MEMSNCSPSCKSINRPTLPESFSYRVQGGIQLHNSFALCVLDGFPHSSTTKNPRITYRRAMSKSGSRLLNRTVQEIEALLGLKAYQDLYEAPAMREDDSFQNWTCAGQCSGMNFTLLCCPEDKRCAKRCPSNTLCPACEIPICATCWDAIALNGKITTRGMMGLLRAKRDIRVPGHIYGNVVRKRHA